MNEKLTKRFIGSKPTARTSGNPPEKDLFVRDTGLAGFGLKVTPTGTVSYIYENRIKGAKSKRTTLGRYPSLPFNEAKDKASGTSKLYRDGIDPLEVEKDNWVNEVRS